MRITFSIAKPQENAVLLPLARIIFITNFEEIQKNIVFWGGDSAKSTLKYVHTMPRGTQRQSAARLRGKSCAMPQVYVDVASAWLQHAVRCCAA